MKLKLNNILLWLILIIIIVLADQYSKALVFNLLKKSQILKVNEWLNLIVSWNKGVSFGLMNEIQGIEWLLVMINIAVELIILKILLATKGKEAIGYVMIIGGALGNLWDRVNYGAVFDFIDFHYRAAHYPAFNLADISIVLGACIVLLTSNYTQNNKNT